MTATNDHGDFYWANGKKVPLFREPRMFAVRFRPGRRSDSAGLSKGARSLLRDQSRGVGFISNHNLQLYEASDEQEGVAHDGRIASRLSSLGGEEAVEFAAPVLRASQDARDVIVPTPRFLVSFKKDVGRDEIDALNAEHNVRIDSRLGYVPNGYILVAPEGDGESGSLRLCDKYYRSGLVEFAMPDLVRPRHLRTQVATEVSPSPRRSSARSGGDLRSEQWHLDAIEMEGAWQITRGKAEVAIAVLDDGFDLSHPEFGDGKVKFQYDYEDGDPDATPSFSDESHGTACAGVAVARGVRAPGAAPGCSLIAIRTPYNLGVAEEAQMFQDAADNGASVISCSWGPTDGVGSVDPLPDSTRAALEYCVEHGRGGLGIPIFWAAGNGSESVSADGYASCDRVIAVAACTDEEAQAWYSDFGPEISIAAPSNGGTRGILTTDRLGSDGYNSGSASLGDPNGDYTNDFGGTSSAAPLAAGVAGLVLSIAPKLRWEQVKQVLEDTADKIGDASEYNNGHSHRFGYGRVNARAAVERARALATSALGDLESDPNSPSIKGPAQVERNGPPPSFTVNAAGRPFMAVEVATESRLFDFEAHGDARNQNNFFPDWDAVGSTTLSSVTWSLPESAWQRLRHAGALYFRVHVASDPDTWADYDLSLEDSEAGLAPSVAVTSRVTDTTTVVDSTGGTTPAERIEFPSGATFAVAESNLDGLDYSDPVGGGRVPLIEVAGRLEEKLSENFTLEEFASREVGSRRKSRYSRVSPRLVELLQELRDVLARPISITSGYRYPALNESIQGAERSQHMAGHAVDIQVAGLTPLRVVDDALNVFGFDIGVGLGESFVHLDLRGSLATWTYDGAEMSESEFDEWVRERRRERRSEPRPRVGLAPLDGFVSVTAPSSWSTEKGPPVFRVRPGSQPYWGLEVVTKRRAFSEPSERNTSTYWRSWTDDLSGAGDSEWVSVTLDPPSWNAMRRAKKLFYRAFTSKSGTEQEGLQITTRDNELDQAPCVRLQDKAKHDAGRFVGADASDRRADESLWRAR